MKTQHTQGEWKMIGKSHGNYISIGTESGQQIEQKELCKVNWSDEGFVNAKLIAAAPDLLESLTNLCNAASGDTMENLNIALADARAVIKKATE